MFAALFVISKEQPEAVLSLIDTQEICFLNCVKALYTERPLSGRSFSEPRGYYYANVVLKDGEWR